MAILDRFKRKKKEEYPEIEMPGEAGYGYGPAGGGMPQGFPGAQGAPGIPELPGMPGMPAYPAAPQAMPSPEIETMKRNIETINYKIDTLKATLDNINARLANIEAALKAPKEERGWTY